MFFDWNRVYKNTDGTVKQLYLVIKMLANKELPKNNYDPIRTFYNYNYSGVSYLLCPKRLMERAPWHSKKEIVEYVALASYRRYADYLTDGVITLSILESPLQEHKIIQNKTLRLDENGLIHFRYENLNKKEI